MFPVMFLFVVFMCVYVCVCVLNCSFLYFHNRPFLIVSFLNYYLLMEKILKVFCFVLFVLFCFLLLFPSFVSFFCFLFPFFFKQVKKTKKNF